MRFKTVNDYQPDAEIDDAPEAVAEAVLTSEARQRLAKLLSERSEANSEMLKAKDAIGRLQTAIASPGPIERDIAQLDSDEASLIAAWSTQGGNFPVLDADRRQALGEALAEAKNRASGAQRAIPSLEAEYARAANSANAITLKINAEIATVILEESLPDVLEIATLKAVISDRMAVASEARELSLRMVESIPSPIRLEIAAGYFRAVGPWETARVAAASTPAPSSAGVAIWRDLADALRSDATAQVAHQAGE
jgi:hypothetical protein